MKHILFLAITTLAAFAQAQRTDRLEREALAVAQEIRQEAPYLSVNQEREIMEHLRAVRLILSGGNGNENENGHGNHGGGYEQSSYTCIARDNDNQAPWVIGVRTGVNVTKINAAQFSSRPVCENTIATGRIIRGNNIICVSRDNDGQAPWQLANLNGTSVTKIQATMVNSLEKCQTFLRELRPRGVNATFCGSRDNDGQAPYQAINVNIETNEVTRGSELFNAVAQCNQFLGTN